METIITRIQERMDERNLSVHALEKQAGLKRGVLQNVLYGRSKNPGIEIIKALAQTLNCTVPDLIDEETTTSVNSTLTHKSQELPFKESSVLPWDANLYKKCFDKVDTILKKENMTFSNAKTLNYVNEVYQYTLQQDRSSPEDHFVKWLLTKSFMRE